MTRRENCTVGITAQKTQLRNFVSTDISMTINVTVERRQFVGLSTCIDENIIQMLVCPDFFKGWNFIGYAGIVGQYAYSVQRSASIIT